MSLGSIEGLVVGLLFVVPGATGIALRGYLWPTRSSGAFDELVRALAYSTAAVLLLELVTGLVGSASSLDVRLGDYLTNDLLTGELDDALQDGVGVWYRLVAFGAVAISLPSALQWLRSRAALVKLIRAGHFSLYNDGFEALFQETLSEAARWDAGWTLARDESPWIMVDTDDDYRYRGQIMWRSTAPEPPQLILANVSDITNPENVVQIPAMLLVGHDAIRRLWVMRPADHEREVEGG